MRRTASLIWLAACCGMLLTTSGCMTAAKTALHELRGAHAELLLVSTPLRQQVAACNRLDFTPATTTLGAKLCPPKVLRAFDRNTRDLRKNEKIAAAFSGGEPTLRVDSEIYYYQEKGLLGGAQLLVHVKMHGGDQLLVDALVVAESKAFREGGSSALSEAGVKAIGKFLRKQKNPDCD